MIKIHTSPVGVEIHNLKNVLEGNDIECQILGEFRKTALGELPVNECWIELWILNDEDEEKARKIIAGAIPEDSKAWQCPKCGEALEKEFDDCWKCQGSETTSPDADSHP